MDTLELEEAEDDPHAGAGEVPSLAGDLPWHDEQGGPLTVAFAGGKGGAGRSLLAANLGVYVSRIGREVILADLDPAGANLHTFLGLEPLLPGPGAALRPAPPPVFERVSGMSLRLCRPSRATSGPDDPVRAEALAATAEQGADVVILDLGNVADPLTLETFLSAHAGVVVVLPEPAGVERAYAFLRAALRRRLLSGDDAHAQAARAVLSADEAGRLQTPGDLLAALSVSHPHAAEAIRARVLAFSPKILVNSCRTRADAEMAEGIASALRRRWGITPEALAAIDYDDAAWNATRQRRPFMLEYPGSTLAHGIERMARRLLAAAARRALRT